jgi:hypothetical protein
VTAGRGRPRLVEQQDVERSNERAGDLGLLAHASGELPREEVESRGKAQFIQQDGDSFIQVITYSVGEADELQMLTDCEVVVQDRYVGHESQPGPRNVSVASVVHVGSTHRHRAGCGYELTRDNTQGGGLA